MARPLRSRPARWVLCSLLLAVCALTAGVAGFSGPAATDAAARWPATGAPDHITIHLRAADGSTVTGKATLRVEGDLTTVAVRLEGEDGTYLAGIHAGTCAAAASMPAFPLTDATTAAITRTTVEIALADLLVQEHVISVQRAGTDLASLLDPESIVACGRIETDELAVLPDDEEFITTWPLTGAGIPGADGRQEIARLAAVLLGGMAAACAGLAALDGSRNRRPRLV